MHFDFLTDEHVVGAEDRTAGQLLKKHLCAAVHGRLQTNGALVNDRQALLFVAYVVVDGAFL